MEKSIIFVVLGIVLAVLGIVNCTGNISSIHWYNRKKVNDADIPAYGKWVGSGTIVCGATLIITAVLEIILQKAAVDWIILIGFAIGLVLILYGQFKYNKGIF